MTTKTRDDLVLEALDVLGVLSTGQPAETEDYSKVDDKVDAIVAELAELEIVIIQDVEAIPLQFFNPLAAIVAETCKNKFGLTAEDVARLQGERATAEDRLRIMNRGKPTGEPQESEWF